MRPLRTYMDVNENQELAIFDFPNVDNRQLAFVIKQISASKMLISLHCH